MLGSAMIHCRNENFTRSGNPGLHSPRGANTCHSITGKTGDVTSTVVTIITRNVGTYRNDIIVCRFIADSHVVGSCNPSVATSRQEVGEIIVITSPDVKGLVAATRDIDFNGQVTVCTRKSIGSHPNLLFTICQGIEADAQSAGHASRRE